MHRRFELVIFDCDGVLVDSEMLSAAVLQAQLKEQGIDLSFAEFRSDFLGRSFASAAAQLKTRTGHVLADDFASQYSVKLNQRFATDLKPMPGIAGVLESLAVDHCVASGSIPPRLDFSLKVCGLDKYFGPKVYSAALVKHAKPAPDLFLYAAQMHHVDPSRCLVIEDSEMGVRAGAAAGMTVWHFAGGAHIKAGHMLPSGLPVQHVVHDMDHLLKLLREAGVCLPEPVPAQVL